MCRRVPEDRRAWFSDPHRGFWMPRICDSLTSLPVSMTPNPHLQRSHAPAKSIQYP